MTTVMDTNTTGAETDAMDFSVGEVYRTVKDGRKLLAKAAIVGALLSATLAFFLANKFTSTAVLMPPDQQSISSPSPMTQMTGLASMSLGGAAGLMSQRTPGQTVVGMLTSDSVLDAVIEKNDLRRVYNAKYIEDARKALLAHSDISEDKKSGLVIISITADDKVLAHTMTVAYLDRLTSLMNDLGTSSAQRERIFLEQRLKGLSKELDASVAALGQFSSQNATIDIQKQGTATLEAASRLQAQLIAAQTELSSLKERFADGSAQVRSAQAGVAELQRRLNTISGMGQKANSDDLQNDQIAPSIRKLPLLAGRYAELYRDVQNKEALFQTLTKQYELARVEESKVVPPVRILQPASTPEKKSGPHRSIIILVGVFVSVFGSAMFLLFQRYWGASR